MSLSLIVLVAVAIGLVWYVLDRREGRRRAAGLPSRGGMRLMFGAAALLLMIYAGGCSAIFIYALIAGGAQSGSYVSWQAIAVLGGPPFALGLLIWWLSMRRKNS